MAGFALAIALTISLYVVIGVWLIRRGRWISAGLAMLAISLVPVVYELAYSWLFDSGANATMSAVIILLWPFAILIILVGVIRLMLRKGPPIDV